MTSLWLGQSIENARDETVKPDESPIGLGWAKSNSAKGIILMAPNRKVIAATIARFTMLLCFDSLSIRRMAA